MKAYCGGVFGVPRKGKAGQNKGAPWWYHVESKVAQVHLGVSALNPC